MVPSLRYLPYGRRLDILNLTTLKDRQVRGDLIQYFKISKGINQVTWVSPNQPARALLQEGPARGIRGSEMRIVRPLVLNCAPRDNFLANQIVQYWNELPPNILNSKTTNEFKKRLDTFYFLKTNRN